MAIPIKIKQVQWKYPVDYGDYYVLCGMIEGLSVCTLCAQKDHTEIRPPFENRFLITHQSKDTLEEAQKVVQEEFEFFVKGLIE